MRPAEEIRYLVLAAQREGSRLLDRALKPLGVTDAQAEVIRVLQDRQPLTLSGLGDLLICESGNSPSRLVARLVDAGLVRREVLEHDRRHVELTLTDEGADIAERILLIEQDLYRVIDTVGAGHDTRALTDFLRAFVADLPAGRAFERRRVPTPAAAPVPAPAATSAAAPAATSGGGARVVGR
jgi:DNA-binding MarR family transcriptional regulator